MRLPHVFGRYTLLRKLANGGMAEVYLARYDGEGGFSKYVAIKRILPDETRTDQFTTMLIDEAKALVHLQHQNIVQVYELGKDDGHFFISMEHVHGIDLGRILNGVIRGHVALPMKFVFYVVAQILQGLEFAHNVVGRDGQPLRIVHRDISPPNILCSWSGEVKVADFGIAKGNHRTHETATNQLKGKYSYMSPEQSMGRPVDHRTDIYAVGIVLFELLSASRLYEDASDLKVLERVRRARVPMSKIGDVPVELREIICTALMRDPEVRYQTAGEFLSALNRYALSSGQVVTGFEFGVFLRETYPDETRFPDVDDPSVGKACASAKTMAVTIATVREKIRISWFHGQSFRRGLVASTALFMSVMLPASAAKKDPSYVPKPIARVESKELLLASPESKGTKQAASNDNRGVPGLEAIVGKAEPAAHDPSKIRTPENSSGGGTISVNAMPWGIVAIPGYVSGRETPVGRVKVKSGEHLITVKNESSGESISKRVAVSDGQSIRCLARFAPSKSLSCK